MTTLHQGADCSDSIIIAFQDAKERESFFAALAAAGYRCAEAAGAEQLIDLMRLERPSLMVLGGPFPDMETDELISELKQRVTALPPYIVIVGEDDAERSVEMILNGAAAVVVRCHSLPERLPALVSRLLVDDRIRRRVAEPERSCQVSDDRIRSHAEPPDQKRLEEQLFHARKLEAVGILAGVVAHDLNNLLTPVLGYASFLKRDLGPDHPSAQGIAAIERSAVRAASMISQLLAYSREIKHINVPVDVKALVDDCSASLKSRISDTISLVVQFLPEVAMTFGDPLQLAQVLEIVVGNALDSMADGGVLSICLEPCALDQEFCRHHPALSPGPHFCLTVSDTGCGIPAEIIPRIFEPFFSTKSPSPGRGMGLALVYSILKNHAAAVTVESAVGEGTTLRIYLPAFQSAQPAFP